MNTDKGIVNSPCPISDPERLACELADIAFWSYEIETGIPWMSAKARALHGFGLKDPISIVDSVNQYAPEARPIIQKAFQDLLDSGVPYDLELPFRSASGEDLIIRTQGIIKVVEGKHILFGTIQDVTGSANRRLTQQQALTHVAKLSALGEMTASVAHEINNPLAIISGLASKMRNLCQKGTMTIAEAATLAERMISVVDRISRIVRSIQGIARVGHDDPMTPTSLNRILEDTLSLCHEKFKNHGVELQMIIPEQDLTIFCRETQIGQILLNLMNNAFDAVKDQPHSWIKLEVTSSANSLLISVSDSGSGIPADLRAKIMEPFFTTKEVGKGTGLGLSISKALIEQHHGKLTLDEQSRNTRFVIELPLIAPKQLQQSA